MLFTADEFCEVVESELNTFMESIAEHTRAQNKYEQRMLAESYKGVSRVFKKAMEKSGTFSKVQVGTTNTVFEYKLPNVNNTCDLVLLGKKEDHYQVLILELKNFDSSNEDMPGEREGLIIHQGHYIKHPSDQVRGYADYCSNFHSVVNDTRARVNGCAYVSQRMSLESYTCPPNDVLVESFPIYNTESEEDLADYILKKIDKGDQEFAARFVEGRYKQNRQILEQIAQSLSDQTDKIRPFILIGNQRLGFNLAMSTLEKALSDTSGKKYVIIISGAPGSGKSAVAINLWIEAVKQYSSLMDDGDTNNNIVYVTTSSCQKANWADIFNKASQRRYGHDVIYSANNFGFGLSGGNMKNRYYDLISEIDDKYIGDPNTKSLNKDFYRDYLQFFLDNGLAPDYADNHHLLSVVDEAHALINPIVDDFTAVNKGGWCWQMGPQAYHIIRQSRISVFFMDEQQSYRDQESTSMSVIRSLAEEFDADFEQIELDGQFRCSGSKEYVDWVESLFSKVPKGNHSEWKDRYKVKVVDKPGKLETLLRAHQAESKNSIRLVSTYSVPWISKGLNPMHTNEVRGYDFDLTRENGGIPFRKYWNCGESYLYFVQAPEGCKMHDDPLCEVGYPLTVRGFDYDYVGILWLDDLVRRKGKWVIRLDSSNFERDTLSSNSKARKEEEKRLRSIIGMGHRIPRVTEVTVDLDNQSSAIKKFFDILVMSYRVLMTRGIKGTAIYIKDKETREYVESLLI